MLLAECRNFLEVTFEFYQLERLVEHKVKCVFVLTCSYQIQTKIHTRSLLKRIAATKAECMIPTIVRSCSFIDPVRTAGKFCYAKESDQSEPRLA